MSTLEFRIRRIRAISDLNPAVLSNVLSPKIFLAIIRCCGITHEYCSTSDPVAVHLLRLCAYAVNIGHFVRNWLSFRKLGSNLLQNSPQRNTHRTSEYAATSMHNVIPKFLDNFRKFGCNVANVTGSILLRVREMYLGASVMHG